MYDCCERRIHYLRVSVTDRCDLRCTYCMPQEGIPLLAHGQVLSLEEIRDVVAVAVRLGVDKVRLTGGEPLVRKGIVALVGMLAAILGLRELAMTTNGSRLAELAQPLRAAGLQRVNVSLDAIDPERYRAITRHGDLARVLAGIAAARDAGLVPIKLNCVVEAGPDEPDARGVAAWAASEGLEVRFIPRMDIGAGRFARVIGGEGGDCARCNRLRLTSDGRIHPCLFSNLSWSVRELGAEQAILQAVAGKPPRGLCSDKRMSATGG
jgi:cyclic pyranopterin phosphate synthase